MNAYIDIYCERLAPGLWAEPLNAVTNLAFFAAAGFAYKLARREDVKDLHTAILIILIMVIGAGSTAFHTAATYWAMLADSLPILAFQVAFLTFYSHDVIGLSRLKTAGLLGLFFLSIVGFSALPGDWLNGSIQYAPALLFLTGLGVYHHNKPCKEKGLLLAASAVFVVSLICRSVDMAVCPNFPQGVHFLWHLLNGFVLYLATRAYILNR